MIPEATDTPSPPSPGSLRFAAGSSSSWEGGGDLEEQLPEWATFLLDLGCVASRDHQLGIMGSEGGPPGHVSPRMGQIVILNSSVQQPSARKNQDHLQPMFVQQGQVQPPLLCTRETSSEVGRSCATQALSHCTWICPVSLQPLFVCSQIGFGGAGKQSIRCFALTGLGSLVIPKHKSFHSVCHGEGFVFPYISDRTRTKDFGILLCRKGCQRELAGAGAGLCVLRCCAVVGWASPGTPQAELCQCSCLECAGEKLPILAVGVAGGQVPAVDPSSGPAGAAGDES